MKILIVDDNHKFRRMLTAWMFKEGHDVHGVDGGAETLDAVRQYQYDLITLDLLLRGMNGLTLLDQIRSIHPDMPVIIMSASADEHIAGEAIRAGAAACFSKPVDFEALRNEFARLKPADHAASVAPGLSLRLELKAF